MNKKSIAVIGQGFVGGSLTTVFAEKGFKVYVYDKAGVAKHGGINLFHSISETSTKETKVQSFVGLCEDYDDFSGVFFVCVPTPMFEDGSADLSIVEGILDEMANVPGDRVAVVKSTVPPGTTEKWNNAYSHTGLRVVFNPEFLTERDALNDMRKQNRIILGGQTRGWVDVVESTFREAFPGVPIIKTTSTTAECVKYFTNVQLAARVVLSCEFKQITDSLDTLGLNVDYDQVVAYATYDSRLGGSHMNVPGHDGIPGARGHCFPKDLNALISVARDVGVKPTVMSAIWEKNLELIPLEHRDWEKMQGRAVSKKPT